MNFNQLRMAAHWICSVCAQRKIYCLDFSCSEGKCSLTIENPLVLFFTLHICQYFLARKISPSKCIWASFECRYIHSIFNKTLNIYFQSSAMFSFWEIMVVCSNNLLLLYSMSAGRERHEVTLHNNLSLISCKWLNCPGLCSCSWHCYENLLHFFLAVSSI